MSGFIRARAKAIRATYINVRTRVRQFVSTTWAKLTLANLRRTICGAPGYFMFLLFAAWNVIVQVLRYLRRTCTLTNLKRAICGAPRRAFNIFMFVVRSVKHVGGAFLGYGKRNWKPLTLLTVSLVLLGLGCLRLHDYDVPMLRGDYKEASRGKTEYDFADKDDAPQPTMFEKDSLLYQLVVASIHTGQQAVDLTVGDRVTAKFNHALSLYRENRYEEAVKAFNNAYRAMSDKDGQVKRGYEKLAAQTQFMIGNALCNSGKDGEAITAYQLSLTYDPNDIVTIYNLERLLSNGGGKGGDKGDKPKPSNINKTKV